MKAKQWLATRGYEVVIAAEAEEDMLSVVTVLVEPDCIQDVAEEILRLLEEDIDPYTLEEDEEGELFPSVIGLYSARSGEAWVQVEGLEEVL